MFGYEYDTLCQPDESGRPLYTTKTYYSSNIALSRPKIMFIIYVYKLHQLYKLYDSPGCKDPDSHKWSLWKILTVTSTVAVLVLFVILVEMCICRCTSTVKNGERARLLPYNNNVQNQNSSRSGFANPATTGYATMEHF